MELKKERFSTLKTELRDRGFISQPDEKTDCKRRRQRCGARGSSAAETTTTARKGRADRRGAEKAPHAEPSDGERASLARSPLIARLQVIKAAIQQKDRTFGMDE